MFDEEYDVLDNIKSIATNTNDDLSEPQTSSAYTVRVQFLHNDNEEERMVQQELLYAFDARTQIAFFQMQTLCSRRR